MRKIPVLLLSSTALLTSVISNAMAAQVGDLQTFKLTPTIDFRADTGDKTVGKLQSLIPILGNENRLFYAFGEGKAGRSSDNGWMVGAGTGYRQVINDAAILGGYVIADYSSSPTKKRFWIANPGVELFTTNWDFRANAYIPMGKNDWSTSTTQTGWADEFGVYDYVKYSGHNQYNRMMSVQQTTREETNSGVGGDAEIGRAIPHIAGLKAYVGGYYYNTANLGHVRGIEGRVTYQLTDHIGLEAIDTHDNLKNNTFLLGLKISFGGFDKKERAQFGISGRLLEPIEHNLATTANGYAAPVKTGTQTTKTFIASNKNNTLSNILKNAQSPTAALTSTDPSTDDYLFVERDNIWYFKAGNISPTPTGKGTYEDPFVSFSQANYKTIDPSLGQNDPSLYFASGSYTFSDFQSRDISNRFMLPSGWSMYGRADNYSRQALGDERPQFNGGLDIGSYSQASRFNTLD